MRAWIAGRWRQSLVLSLTVLGIAAVAVLAFVGSSIVGDQIRHDALSRAQATAEVLARSSFAPRLPADDKPLPRRDRRDLDAQVAAARASQPGTEAELRVPGGRLLYSSDPSAPQTASVGDFAPGTHVIGKGGERRVRSTLPVRPVGGGAPRAFLQLSVPYGPVAHDITARTRRLDILLALTALAVYLLALPSLVRAGRAVRAQYDPRALQLAHDLKRAIKRGEITINYQPIVDSRTGKLRTVEALVRWTDPHRGPIAPASFIPAIEQTDTIWDLSEHIFRLVCQQWSDWHAQGYEISIAVNVSGAILLDRRLVAELDRLAREHSLPPDVIEIEITEGALVQDPREAAKVLTRIAGLGLRVIAIDDFGTGYSSLARLQELPLDTLKIDQSFVRRLAEEGDQAIVRSVIDLAHALSLDVIAEGVEDDDTAKLLAGMGAEYLQGYGISKPRTADSLVEWLGEEAGVPFVPGLGVKTAA